MLITGTPLHNNLKELFALLNFICLEIFFDYKDLDSFRHKDDSGVGGEEEKRKKVVEALHKILRPFLLRRVKADVEKNLLPSEYTISIYVPRAFCVILTEKEINIYAGLTEMQRKCTIWCWRRTLTPSTVRHRHPLLSHPRFHFSLTPHLPLPV